MKKVLAGLMVTASLLSAASLPTYATTKTAKMAAMTIKCPSCGMPMSTKKSKAAPVAVKIKGVTYYCCAGCASGKAAMKAAMKPAAKKM